LLNIVTQITLDKLRLSPLTDVLTKTLRYDLSLEQFNYLKKLRLIPEDTLHDGVGFNITYDFSSEQFDILKDLLKRFDYQNKPTDALYTILTLSVFGTFFTYQLKARELAAVR